MGEVSKYMKILLWGNILFALNPVYVMITKYIKNMFNIKKKLSTVKLQAPKRYNLNYIYIYFLYIMSFTFANACIYALYKPYLSRGSIDLCSEW